MNLPAKKLNFTVLTAIVLLTNFASFDNPCRADIFGPENPIKLPTISAKELESVEKQLKSLLPKLAASVVRIDEGSGVIISPDGLILSHCHGGQTSGTSTHVYLAGGQKVSAKYLGVHRNFDVALIRLKGRGPWPFAPIASAQTLRIGQCCFTMGHPGGFSRTVSAKALLRMSRILEIDPRQIYSNAPLEAGDSGGPMFNLKGEVIGIAEGVDREPVTRYTRADLVGEIYGDLLNGAFIERNVFASPLNPDSTNNVKFELGSLSLGTPATESSEGSNIPEPLHPHRTKQTMDKLASMRSAVERQAGTAMVAIFDQRTKRNVGSGTIIDSSGLVLTHGTGIIGPKRIGRTFDVMVGNGNVTTGRYLGVHRGFRLSLMQLEKRGESNAPWPVAKIGNPDDVKPGMALVMLRCPAKLSKNRLRPRTQPTRALAITNNRIYTPLEDPTGESGAALFGEDGHLLGIKGWNSPEFARADLYAKIKDQLLASKFVPKFRYPYAFNILDAATLPPVYRSVVRITCGGQPVAHGVVITRDGNIVTKASALSHGKILCEFSDGKKLNARLLGRSSLHDLAVLDVEASGLPAAEFSSHRADQGTILFSIGVQSVPLGAGVLGSGPVAVPRDKGRLGFNVEADPVGDGVQVREVLYSLTKTVLREADVLTHFDNQVIRNVTDFDRLKNSYFQSERSFAGELIPATIRRRGQTLQVMIPIELEDEQNRSRPITQPIAPLLPDGLLGRHNGFPSVFVHDALARTPCKVDSIEAFNAMSRKHLGSPVVDLSGKVVGINIASYRGTFAYALPAETVIESLRLIRRGVANKND